MNKKKFDYSFEEVANFTGFTKQTLCNWSGCNKSYHSKNMKNKTKAAAAMFIFYHLYGKRNIEKIKENIEKLKKKCNTKEVLFLEKEIKKINSLYKKIQGKDLK